MPTIEKKATNQVPTIGQLLAIYFHCDDAKHLTENVIDAWLCVLSNLDHQTGNHFGPTDVQLISEFLMDFKRLATDSHASLVLAAK